MSDHLRGIKPALAAFVLAVFAACAASAPAATLYTNNYSDEQIAVLSSGSDGLLTPLAGSPFAVGDFVGSLAITPDGERLVAPFYFNNRLGLFGLAADGTPSPLGPALAANVDRAPAISPDGRFVYLGADVAGVLAFAIGDGSLAPIGGAFGSAGGEGPALTPDGRYLLMPDYLTGSIERFAVQPDGSLVSLGITPADGIGARSIRVTPDGRFAVLLSEPEGLDSIQSFAIGADGSLAPVSPAVATVGAIAGSTPALSPDGRFYYSGNGNEESISVYSLDANGALAASGPAVPAGVGDPDGLAISPDGRFLYAVDLEGFDVQAFAVAADGSLTQIGALAPTGGGAEGVGPVVRPSVPIARLAAQAAAPGAISSFDASGSSDVGGPITTYGWSFGDGTTLTGPDPKPSHVYEKAGVYEVTLTVGCGPVFVYTGQTAYCNGKAARATVKLDTLPAISSLKAIRLRPGTATATAAASARKGKRKPPKRVAFEYVLSEEARLAFTVERKVLGRKAGGKCQRRTKGNAAKPKCVLRWGSFGGFAAAGKAGANIARLPNLLGGRKPPPGAYRAIAVATDPAGGVSAPRSAGFRIKKPKRR